MLGGQHVLILTFQDFNNKFTALFVSLLLLSFGFLFCFDSLTQSSVAQSALQIAIELRTAELILLPPPPSSGITGVCYQAQLQIAF